MRKTINISGKACNFKSSAFIPRMYRMKFGRDIFIDLAKIDKAVRRNEKEKEEAIEKAKEDGIEVDRSELESTLPIDSLEMFENIAFLMHKHGDKEQPGDIEEWIEQFETFDIYEVLPEIMDMWKMENAQTSHAKKKNEK